MMDTLNRELEQLVERAVPPLIDLAALERLVTEDERSFFDGECSIHEGCRRI